MIRNRPCIQPPVRSLNKGRQPSWWPEPLAAQLQGAPSPVSSLAMTPRSRARVGRAGH